MRRAAAAFALGLLVGASPHLAGASRDAGAAVAPPRPPDHLTGPPPVPVVEPVEPAELDPWHVELPDDPGGDAAAGCAIDLLDLFGLDVAYANVAAVLDWSYIAYGGPCAHLDAVREDPR